MGWFLKTANSPRLIDPFSPTSRCLSLSKNRIYFYVPLANGKYPNREPGLGNNVYTQRFRNILGSGPEMTKLWNKADQDPNKFESLVIDAGYDGYAPYDMGMVVLLNHDVPVNYQGVGVKPEDIKKWSIRSAPLENDILSKVAKDLDLTPQIGRAHV